MDTRRVKVDLPSLFSVVLTGVIIFISVVALRFSQTKYLVESIAPGTLSRAFDETEAKQFQQVAHDAILQTASASAPNKKVLDIASFVMWFLFGLVCYYLCYGIYMAFIHPISEDVTAARFVHANKESLLKRRTLWVMAIIFTGTMVYGVYTVYHTVLAYYTQSIFQPGIINGLVLLASITVASLMVAIVRIGLRVIVRSY